MFSKMQVVAFSYFAFLVHLSNGQGTSSIARHEREDCSVNEFFDFSHLKCTSCPINTTQSQDRLSCVCKLGFHKVHDYGGLGIRCALCERGKVPTPDGWKCQNCEKDSGQENCPRKCKVGEFMFVRNTFGTTEPTRKCRECHGNTRADHSCKQSLFGR